MYDDENKEEIALGLRLHSTQIGMSLGLQNYSVRLITKSIFLDKVNNFDKAVLWSDVFRKCFGYLISPKLVDATKDVVEFYLVNDTLTTIGCVATFIKDNQLGIHSLGVLDVHRKQGFSEGVMRTLLQEAKGNGLENAHLQSSMLGLRIYRKIGFEEIFNMCNYRI